MGKIEFYDKKLENSIFHIIWKDIKNKILRDVHVWSQGALSQKIVGRRKIVGQEYKLLIV